MSKIINGWVRLFSNDGETTGSLATLARRDVGLSRRR
jgi:hypothetical protein